MKSKTLFLVLLNVITILLLTNCKKDNDTNPQPEPTPNEIVQKYLTIDLDNPLNYARPNYPAHYDANVLNTDNAPNINRVTDRGATLGRVIFYDNN